MITFALVSILMFIVFIVIYWTRAQVNVGINGSQCLPIECVIEEINIPDTNYKQENTYTWFNNDALLDAHMARQSGWPLSANEFDVQMREITSMLNPPIIPTSSVYEFGCGVGAALTNICNNFNVRIVGGCDFSENAISKIKENFPNSSHRFHVGDMRIQNKLVEASSYDHSISCGAMAMYLDENGITNTLREAFRITKPGGSMCFSHFIEPEVDGRGSIIHPITKKRMHELLGLLSVENVKIKDFEHETQKGRYIISCNKQL